MSSKSSVSSSGGNDWATDGSTPVRSAIVRPYSKRVIRRSGAGPGSAAQSGDVCVVVPPPLAFPLQAPSASTVAATNDDCVANLVSFMT
jgi:hypothetical protein